MPAVPPLAAPLPTAGGRALSVDAKNKVRNYLLGRLELGQPYDNILDHFAPLFTRTALDHILSTLGLPSLADDWFPQSRRLPRTLKAAA